MEPIAESMMSGARRMLELGGSLVRGVEPDRFARFAAPGGHTVHANHGAFVYGHLSLYPSRLLVAGGEDPGPAACPEAWGPLFGSGAECRDDPDGSIYPAMSELVRTFQESHAVLLERVGTWTDSRMRGRHSIEGRLGEIFPTLGQLTAFLLLGHPMMHLGQVSTWRRAMGLGPAT